MMVRWRSLRSKDGLLLAALGAASLLTVALLVHGLARLALFALVVALITLAQRAQSRARRTALLACREVVGANGQRMQDLSSLQSALAHELNNPLATIKALAGLMALEPNHASLRLPTLRAEILRMQRIIEELLDFSRPMTPLLVERLDLRALVQSVAELHEGLASAKHVELVAEPGEPIMMKADPRKLKQALMALLENAIEASPEHETIALTVVADEGRVRVAVVDRGPGIPAGDLSRMTRAGMTTKANAAGLGLTMARALVEQHGGSLTLENRSGGGFEARCELPLECTQKAAAPPSQVFA